MKGIDLTGSRLNLPRTINDAELAPKGTARYVSFDIIKAEVILNDNKTIAVGLHLNGGETIACVVLDIQSAKFLAESVLNIATAGI